MLGQLLHSINPRRNHSRQATFIESDIEDAHTRSLLFPDLASLHQPEHHPQPLSSGSPVGPFSPAGSYDALQREIDLDAARDIRIIIAQDESGPMARTVLFDSKPPTWIGSPTPVSAMRGARPSTTPTSAGPSPQHARRSSIGLEHPTPKSPGVGVFGRARSRGSSISSLADIGVSSFRPRETDEQTKNCMDCMFGNTAMSYRGASNKLHIVPLEQKATDRNTDHFISEGRFSLPRGETRKPSHLSKSYIPSDPSLEPVETPTETQESSPKDRRRTIMISRIFSVTLPDDTRATISESTPSQLEATIPGRKPRNMHVVLPSAGQQRRSSRKLPMFGISVIIQLPVGPARPISRHTCATQRTGYQSSTAMHGQESLASSLDSDAHGSWSWIDSNSGVDSWLSNSYVSDVDDRVDLIGKHWDVIIRTLTTLQQLVQKKITYRFKAQDDAYYQSLTQSVEGAAQVPRPPPPFRNIRLPPNAFASDPELMIATNMGSERIVRGVKIPRVMTGQGRWGVWREEARWLGRWAGTKEENFFFFTLLTAFLGHHTEWLNILGPRKDRKLHRYQQMMKAGEDFTIPNRTVIVSTDKMAARRLIFLLSAFLPSSSPIFYDTSSPVRPSTSASDRGYSQSPPSHAPMSRQQSLRRTINRRGRASQTSMRLVSRPTIPQLDQEEDEGPPSHAMSEHRHHYRHASDRSTHTTLAIPAMSDRSNTGKSSAATTSTVTPESAMPIAHFTTRRTPSTGPPEARPSSSESLASANLIHTLKRTGSSHHASHPSTDSSASRSRWGSLISFWSGSSRDSSTDQSEIIQSTDEGLGISILGYRKPADASGSRLEQMVREIEINPGSFGDEPGSAGPMPENDSPRKDDADGVEGPTSATSAAMDIPERPKRAEPMFKMSVNEKDGIIDVDIPLPGFGSQVQSPFLPPFTSSSSLEASSYGHASTCSFSNGEFEQPVNVAGWLGNKLHPDFALQGVTSYVDLDADIRRAMSVEPTSVSEVTLPSGVDSGPIEKWIDVCSTLVADTRTFTVKRLRLRRLIRLIPNPVQAIVTPAPTATVPKRHHHSASYVQDQASGASPASELHLEEEIIEEPIMDIDEVLANAVERVLSPSGQSTGVQSATSSRSSSRRGRLDSSVMPDNQLHASSASTSTPVPVLEIPRAKCKYTVLGALEQVVKEVVAERDSLIESQKKDSGGNIIDQLRSRIDSTLREGIRRWLAEVDDLVIKKDELQPQRH